MTRTLLITVAAIAMAIGLSSCATKKQTTGVLIGTAAGAGIGALIGRGPGAIIGGAAGAIVGGAVTAPKKNR